MRTLGLPAEGRRSVDSILAVPLPGLHPLGGRTHSGDPISLVVVATNAGPPLECGRRPPGRAGRSRRGRSEADWLSPSAKVENPPEEGQDPLRRDVVETRRASIARPGTQRTSAAAGCLTASAARRPLGYCRCRSHPRAAVAGGSAPAQRCALPSWKSNYVYWRTCPGLRGRQDGASHVTERSPYGDPEIALLDSAIEAM
jgi:hypothetical protein